MLLLIFLSSGLFLGWSLGANDASNIFGTAVATRMVKFRTAAVTASLFIIIGAVISGDGTSNTIGKLGEVTKLAGAFMVALSAALTVLWMTRLSLPVSTSQAIVGSIIGWSLFSGNVVNLQSLGKIASTWVISPPLAAIISLLLYILFRKLFLKISIHLFRMDVYLRVGLIIVGAFGAYSLGANNIANVVGVFMTSNPFTDFSVGPILITGNRQLLLLGSLAISAGVFTYSKRVMMTVGSGLVKLTPETALIVVLSQSIVLLLFASKGLETWLIGHGLPAFPLVPLSSSQVVIGSVLGIGLAHGGKGIRYRQLLKIASGWISTPIIAAIISFFSLFIIQNVFDLPVF